MFVGRGAELLKLQAFLAQTKAGLPANFAVTGERGIGKSSLLNFVKHLAEGMEFLDHPPMAFLVIDTDIDPNTTQLGLIKKIELGMSRTLGKTERAREFLKNSWQFLQRIEPGGLKLRVAEQTQHDELLLEEFAYSLADVAERLCNEGDSAFFGARFDGILILIDEADHSSRQLSLGSFFKLLTERLQRRGCSRVAFGLAGLPELRAVLSDKPHFISAPLRGVDTGSPIYRRYSTCFGRRPQGCQ